IEDVGCRPRKFPSCDAPQGILQGRVKQDYSRSKYVRGLGSLTATALRVRVTLVQRHQIGDSLQILIEILPNAVEHHSHPAINTVTAQSFGDRPSGDGKSLCTPGRS